MAPFARLVAGLVAVVRLLAVATLLGLVLVLLLAIAVRELGAFGGAITWAEEAERFLFIWLVFLGSPVALDRGEHILIDIFARRVQGRPALVLVMGVRLLVLGLLGVMLYAGVDLTLRTRNQTAAALEIPMSVVHAALPVGAAVMALQLVLLLFRDSWALLGGARVAVTWRTGSRD